MKRYIKNLVWCVLAVCGGFFSACEDMENEPLELQTDIYVWDEDDYTGEYAVQWLNYIYSFVPTGYDRVNGQVLDALTDDAIPTDASNKLWSQINSGYSVTNMFSLNNKMNDAADRYGESWELVYKAIRYCNIFLHNYKKVPWSDLEEANYYGNEARALRAYFYWLLVRTYGGVPLIGDQVFEANSPELKQLKRSSFAECVQYIRDEFSAVKENLRPYSDLGERQSPNEDKNSEAEGYDKYFSNVRKWGLMGVEARMMLYAASPLFNGTGNAGEPWLGYPENDMERWKEAADLCRTIINSGQFKLEKDRTRISRTTINGEVLWLRNGQTGNGTYAQSWGYRNSPMGTIDPGSKKLGACNGQTSPTQELVDAFPMKNGKTIEEAKASGEYDPQNPYENRDPRLSQTVFYNGGRWLKRTLDMSEGGTDNNRENPNNEVRRTKTGYYLKRHLAQDEESSTFSKTNYHATMPGAWMIVRYADILLMYAEAQTEYLNKAKGQGTITDELVYTAIEQVRERAGLNPYTLKRNMSYEELIKIIRNERRCEFAFEESRFWDIRRWKIAEEVLSKPLHGVKITKNADESFHYDYDMVVANPYWDNRMYLLPIDNNEVLFNPNLKQNPGY
ncbi:RagB/SusD family nutrient uptake outer membrane protein [Bacteroides sp.]|uniref:RagB/SusD family nutrient uptake outer membrane protein n=1 Tax=Bacteroides sp. TaxID=29523 RepID=UPI00257DDD0C|nr:RagB/SusD family nutrient uptake outer membrane protein [Bacteroides sp.]